MEARFITSYCYSNGYRNLKTPSWTRNYQEGLATTYSKSISKEFFSKSKICFHACARHERKTTALQNPKFFTVKAKKTNMHLKTDPMNKSESMGTVFGAVALIIGTSIGSGILALPKRTAAAGFLPSAVSIVLCWGFLLIEALLLVEINVALLKKRRKKEENELEVISIRTMAQETLGELGGTVATINYIFLGYTSMVAYTSKSGEILYHLINLPTSISGIMFTTLFTILLSVGGTRTTDQINQWLTASMIGLLLAIEVLAVSFGGWSGLDRGGDWGNVPGTIPVIIFSLVYHDLTPVLCAYLEGDLRQIRMSVMLGSLVPLIALLVWDAIALSLSSQVDPVADPVDLLMRVQRCGGVSVMVEAFSLLAIGTSLIGTLLGFSKFFLEQLSYFSNHFPSTQTLQQKAKENCELGDLREESRQLNLRNWWGHNKLSITAMAMAVVPSLFVSTTVSDAFSAATDIAGGYCMTTLYGVLPPAMAWAMHTRSGDDSGKVTDDCDGDQKALSRAKPALVGVGLFACGIVMNQILQDLSVLHP